MNSKEFDKILREKYNLLEFEELSELTGKAVNTVQKRIKLLGLEPDYTLRHNLKKFKSVIYNDIIYDRYLISKKGIILDLNNRGKTIKYRINSGGYYVFNIKDNGKLKTLFLHKVIAEVYKPNPKPGIYNTVNHKSGIKTDFDLDNLEWTTRKGNTDHAYETGLMDSKIGEKSNFSKFSNEEIKLAKKLLDQFPDMSPSKIKSTYKLPMSASYLTDIRNGRRVKYT